MKLSHVVMSLVLVMFTGCSADESGPSGFEPDAGSATNEHDHGIGADAGAEPAEQVPDMGADATWEEPAGWLDLAPLPGGPRQETAVVAVGDEIAVIGGFNARLQIVPTMEIYDTREEVWRSAADVPVPLHHANVAVIDGEIWVVGFLVSGFAADGRIFSYSMADDAWTPRGEMPAEQVRAASGVGVIAGRIYLVGGLNGTALTRVSSFDPIAGAWSTHAPLPRAMDHGAFGVVGGKLVIIGGRNASIGAHVPDVDIYDPSTDAWTSGAPMPTSRGGVATATVDGKIFVLGGEGAALPGGVFDAVEAYDVAADTWEVLDPMPTPRHGMGAAAVNGTIYVPGGATVQAFGAVDHHDRLRP